MTDLTTRERKVLSVYTGLEPSLPDNGAATIAHVAKTAFPSFPEAKRDRVVRNTIRRLISFGLLMPVGKGAYRVVK